MNSFLNRLPNSMFFIANYFLPLSTRIDLTEIFAINKYLKLIRNFFVTVLFLQIF